MDKTRAQGIYRKDGRYGRVAGWLGPCVDNKQLFEVDEACGTDKESMLQALGLAMEAALAATEGEGIDFRTIPD